MARNILDASYLMMILILDAALMLAQDLFSSHDSITFDREVM